MATQSAQRILLPLSVLAIFALVLPIRATIVGRRVTSTECLALTADAPRGTEADRIALYERCLAVDPTDVEVMARLASQLETADPARAESLYRRALAIDPGYDTVRLRLGELLWRRGDLPGARREAAAALEGRPNSRDVLDLLRRAGGVPEKAGR